jgi:hypothetical protein
MHCITQIEAHTLQQYRKMIALLIVKYSSIAIQTYVKWKMEWNGIVQVLLYGIPQMTRSPTLK